MDVEVTSRPDTGITNFTVRLTDYENGPPGYLTAPDWLELSSGDQLIVRSQGSEYRIASLDDGTGIYSLDLPFLPPEKYGVMLIRPGHISAETGSIEQLYDLSLDLPIEGTVFQSDDTINAQWSLNGLPPNDSVAQSQLRTSIKLVNCIDAAGNVVLENNPDRQPIAPFGWPLMTSNTLSASASDLLEMAVGLNNLNATPAVVSCNVQLAAYTVSYFNEFINSKTDSLVEVLIDPTLSLQEWTVQNWSNSVEVTILR